MIQDRLKSKEIGKRSISPNIKINNYVVEGIENIPHNNTDKTFVSGEAGSQGQVITIVSDIAYLATSLSTDNKPGMYIAVNDFASGDIVYCRNLDDIICYSNLEEGFVYLGINSYPVNQPQTTKSTTLDVIQELGYAINANKLQIDIKKPVIIKDSGDIK